MCAHQVHKVQGEYVNTAGHSGQSADDGGENAETTSTEQKVLQRNIQSEKSWLYSKLRFYSYVMFNG